MEFLTTNSQTLQYVSWTPEDAVQHYLTRISSRIPQFQTMEEKDLNYIKVCILDILSSRLTKGI